MVAVLGERLDSMLWEVFSNLNNSMIKNGIPAGLSQTPMFPSPRYVPALRPLRQQSFLLSFPRTAPSRLAQRLSEVCGVPGPPCPPGWVSPPR